MFTLTTHFRELLKNIMPPQERLDAARELPPLVRDYLKDHEDFATVAPHSHLVGSYAQGLAVGDVKDVDFLVSVPGDPDENEPEAKKLISDLKDVLDDLHLRGEIDYHGCAEIDIERARRSVHVYFEGRDFHLDVVPCIAPEGFHNKIYVPDRSFNKWIASHPVGVIKLLNDLNDEHNEKVKPLGKLFKHFRNYQMVYCRPKSYWLCALLVHHVNAGNLDTSKSLAELFRDLLDAIYLQYDHLLWMEGEYTPNIPDPMLGHNVSWNWGYNDFVKFMRRIDEARQWASKALETEDRAKAIGYWQKVFGEEYFPSEVTEAARHLADTARPGIAVVNSSGLITAISAGRAVVTKETTFHGPEED